MKSVYRHKYRFVKVLFVSHNHVSVPRARTCKDYIRLRLTYITSICDMRFFRNFKRPYTEQLNTYLLSHMLASFQKQCLAVMTAINPKYFLAYYSTCAFGASRNRH